jgi:hypothetical protein
MRDVAAILGISHQQVHQLLTPDKPQSRLAPAPAPLIQDRPHGTSQLTSTSVDVSEPTVIVPDAWQTISCPLT